MKMGFFKYMDSMARDMRHPNIPSTTVLGDNSIVKSKPIGVATMKNALYLMTLMGSTHRLTHGL